MLRSEKRAAFSLALVYIFRMLGLFMILPVMSIYAHQYSGATPVLIGLAIGIYGLTQGLFQLPLGYLSDRIGRKTVIVFGLLIFAFGSGVAAEADSIQQVIIGRALQGLGAIAAAVMALAADLTREEVRLRVMAIIGMSIGASFMVAMIFGPILAAEFGLRALFWLIAVLAVMGILVVVFITPNPERQQFHPDTQLSWRDVSRVAVDRELLKLNFGIFVLHLTLSATFVVFPLMLQNQLGVEVSQHWLTYLPVFLISFVFLVPMIIVSEKLRRTRPVFLSSVALLLVAQVGFAFSADSYIYAFVMLVAFFIAFNFLEAALPSAVSRLAPAGLKGTAMGLYSSAQFLGIFCGGLLGGALLGSGDYTSTFIGLAVLLGFWLLVAATMQFSRDVKPTEKRAADAR